MNSTEDAESKPGLILQYTRILPEKGMILISNPPTQLSLLVGSVPTKRRQTFQILEHVVQAPVFFYGSTVPKSRD